MPRKKRPPHHEQAPNGKYYVYWTVRDKRGRTRTKRETLGAEEERAANAAFADWLIRNQDLYIDGANQDELTVSMVLDDYWREHGAEQISSRSIGHRIDRLKEGLGPYPVAELDAEQIKGYAQKRRDGKIVCPLKWYNRGVGDGTVRGELATLATAIRFAVKRKRLDAAKAPVIDLPSAPEPKPLWLYPDEILALFKAGEGSKIGDFCRIAYYTAARRRSVETLTVFQVSLERGRIALDRPGATPTKKRRPTVPIAKPLRPTIERCLAETSNEYLLGGNGDRLAQFDRLLKEAGMLTLPERDLRPAGKPTPHTLRHSRATHLLQQGVSPWAVSQLLGDRLETVTRVYAHWCGEHLAEALDNVKEIG